MTDANDTLRRNLTRLAQTEPDLAARLDALEPAPLEWAASKSGPLTATIETQGRPLALASRYNPQAEAEKLTQAYDATKHACAVIVGFGLGYHAAHLARQFDERSLLIVFEPDLAVLRAAFERIDHSDWLGLSNVMFADSTTDRSSFIGRIEKFGGIITQGTVLVTHPPTRQRHPQAVAAFGEMVTDATSYLRTNVATALVNASRTMRNVLLNLAYYAAGATTNELVNAAQGKPAVCVGAGPSLAKNVDLLRDPAVRDNIVLITAQTTLKPLLQRGIKPDFVTALDYHEISKRFYEGLDALPDVTLVAEPKANPAILDTFPGPIRVTSNKALDAVLGDLARPVVPIQAGATVAHLSFYLAQHLGCDPIIFIGQDLGFSDGLYYCPGTAIHDVWATELSAFNTLEMMEWQRIVRHRGHLQRLDDVHGRPIFSDEQMLTYLKQFERDFARASQTIIDATEGGVPRQMVHRMTLADALSTYATSPVPKLPEPDLAFDRERLAAARELIETRTHEVRELRQLAQKTVPMLRQIREHQRDYERTDRLYDQVDKNRRRVDELYDAFNLINDINTVGAFRRARADRAIRHAEGDEFDRQKQQIDRDIANLEFMTQACDEGSAILRDALDRLKAFDKQAKASGSPAHASATV